MKLHRMEHRANGGYTTWGCIWPKGEVSEQSDYQLTNEDGTIIPVQSRVTAYWPDHSVKWTAHTANSDVLGENIEVVPVHEKTGTLGIQIDEDNDAFLVKAGSVSLRVMKHGENIVEDFWQEGRKAAKRAELCLVLEEREHEGGIIIKREVPYAGTIREAQLEENGLLKCVIKLSGTHQNAATGAEKLPFVLRIVITYNNPKLDFIHTFIYDGDEKNDFLKGIGVRFYTELDGEVYNRHVKFGVDHGVFHEALALLSSWRPRVEPEYYEAQIAGGQLNLAGEEAENAREAAANMPVWGEYKICQDSPTHFSIQKKISVSDCCYLTPLHGNRAPGYMAFGGESGGLMVGMKDFWQKYPSTFTVQHLDQEESSLTVWFYPPETESFDFRHYAARGYSQTYYEGFDELGATPYGIANTNEFSVQSFGGMIVSDEELAQFGAKVQKPVMFIADPEYYHALRAFGYWSLKKTDTEMEIWLEDQLDRAIAFYQKEIEIRNWYGLFDYGDIMHTYDKVRHCWRYDMGGYAWQNTELVPTLWLWNAFMRTGREDIFTLAEAMTRHCSEVDTYHIGPIKGIGSRHNVRHWGCSCKEARIAMAGHHRFYYYMTGDYRMADVFDDVKDADFALLEIDPLRFFYDKEKMKMPTHARSGPDWSSFCSNWLTQWERFDDTAYRDKMQVGGEDLKVMPLKLTSGTDFEYDPQTGHFHYIGELAAGGSHLQICMGGPLVWFEMADLLEDEEWKDMLAAHGRFYYLPKEKQQEESNGLIGERQFSLPFMAAGIASYGAARLQDQGLAKKTWEILLHALVSEHQKEGFAYYSVANAGNQESLQEIPWISTNFVSQWCLNTITALDFIREELPKDMDALHELLTGLSDDGFRKA